MKKICLNICIYIYHYLQEEVVTFCLPGGEMKSVNSVHGLMNTILVVDSCLMNDMTKIYKNQMQLTSAATAEEG